MYYEKQKKMILIITVFFWFAQYVYMPFQTPFLSEIGVTSTFIGIVVGAYGFSQMILRVPVGFMADKKPNHKFFIILGLITASVASIFRILIPTSTGFLIGNLCSGIASATWISFMVFYGSIHTQEEQKSAMGKIIAANNFGILMGFIAASLLYDVLGMRFLCILGLASGAISVLLAVAFIKQPKVPIKPAHNLFSVVKNKRIFIFAIFALIQQGIVMTTAMSFTTKVLGDMGATSKIIGMSSVVYITFAVISSAIAGSKAGRNIKPEKAIPPIILALAVYTAFVPNCQSVWQILVIQILAGVSQGMLFAYCVSEAMVGVPKEKKSTALGIYQAIFAIGMTCMPPLAGKISDNINMKAAYYFLSIIALIGFFGSINYYKSVKVRAKQSQVHKAS